MLSKYIAKQQAYFNHYQQNITLTCIQEELHIDLLNQQYRKVKILSLTHCRIRSLEGIQQFEELEELNVKFNNITQVQQLYRIANKQLIHRLQFTGNDIEYYGSALFINLVQVFPNLIELNGKNYFSIIHKNSNKNHQMKKIVAQSHKLQKQMLATIRKADLQTKQHKRYTESRLQNTKNNYPTQRDNESSLQKREQNSRQLQYTSKKQKSMAYSQRNETEQKQNLNSINKQEYDVSLGDISNIPMTKSIRGSYVNLTNSQLKQNKKKGLQIFTLNESINKLPLSQPTATFAMQRERQNGEIQSNLMFKNRQKYKYKATGQPIEEYAYESKEEYERPTKRQTYQSVSDDPNQSCNSSISGDNIMRQYKLNNQLRNEQFAQAFYLKNLITKAFYSWKNKPCQKNLPMKRQFL